MWFYAFQTLDVQNSFAVQNITLIKDISVCLSGGAANGVVKSDDKTSPRARKSKAS